MEVSYQCYDLWWTADSPSFWTLASISSCSCSINAMNFGGQLNSPSFWTLASMSSRSFNINALNFGGQPNFAMSICQDRNSVDALGFNITPIRTECIVVIWSWVSWLIFLQISFKQLTITERFPMVITYLRISFPFVKIDYACIHSCGMHSLLPLHVIK